jgi:predicted XRE-type DNA-binding protein
MKKKKEVLPAHEIGTGNIFADLGLPNPEEHQLKAALVVQLHRVIKAKTLTQTAAAKLIGIKQPDLSNILRGHYQGFSIERLMRMLTAFDQDARSGGLRPLIPIDCDQAFRLIATTHSGRSRPGCGRV